MRDVSPWYHKGQSFPVSTLFWRSTTFYSPKLVQNLISNGVKSPRIEQTAKASLFKGNVENMSEKSYEYMN